MAPEKPNGKGLGRQSGIATVGRRRLAAGPPDDERTCLISAQLRQGTQLTRSAPKAGSSRRRKEAIARPRVPAIPSAPRNFLGIIPLRARNNFHALVVYIYGGPWGAREGDGLALLDRLLFSYADFNSTQNRLPVPSSDSRPTVPPIRLRARSTTARPMPVPS